MKLRRPLRQRLNEALPCVWLTREGLMDDLQVALLACSFMATEVLTNIKPSVSFAEGVKAGDATPYSLNHLVRKEGRRPRESSHPAGAASPQGAPGEQGGVPHLPWGQPSWILLV